jgi:hypothetical protein
MNEITMEDYMKWQKTPLVNPQTGRKMKMNGQLYKRFENKSKDFENELPHKYIIKGDIIVHEKMKYGKYEDEDEDEDEDECVCELSSLSKKQQLQVVSIVSEYSDDLKSYLDDDLQHIINSVKVGDIDISDGKSICIVQTTRKLDQTELTKIIDYISGQYSDGWGENGIDLYCHHNMEDFSTMYFDHNIHVSCIERMRLTEYHKPTKH